MNHLDWRHSRKTILGNIAPPGKVTDYKAITHVCTELQKHEATCPELEGEKYIPLLKIFEHFFLGN